MGGGGGGSEVGQLDGCSENSADFCLSICARSLTDKVFFVRSAKQKEKLITFFPTNTIHLLGQNPSTIYFLNIQIFHE